MVPITLAQLKDRLQQLVAGLDSANPTVLSDKLMEFFQYSIENYDQLDADAKAYIDQVSERLQGALQAVVDKLPEGPQTRQLLRQLGLAGGGHFQADRLIQILESPSFEHPILPASKSILTRLLQNTLDVLFDATRHTHQGVANFAKVGLCYWAIDELLAAIHLAQRAFANQSYAHIRTAFEILDLVELFEEQPDWAKLWVSGDDKEVWADLRPSAVRKKRGEPKFDPMYSFFSELGSHGTFRGLQARGGLIVKKNGEKGEEDRKRFKIWVGGTPQIHHIVWTNSLCVYTGLKLLVSSARAFAQYLDAEEMKYVLESESLVGKSPPHGNASSAIRVHRGGRRLVSLPCGSTRARASQSWRLDGPARPCPRASLGGGMTVDRRADRAYRYCCHDLGHAMMSLLLAARALGLPGGVVILARCRDR